MRWDVSTLSADHGDATAFRVEARHEFVEVLIRNPRVRAKVAPVVFDPGEHHPSRWAEPESRVAGDERLDALTELVGEGCHGGVLAGGGWAGIGIGSPRGDSASASTSRRTPFPGKARRVQLLTEKESLAPGGRSLPLLCRRKIAVAIDANPRSRY